MLGGVMKAGHCRNQNLALVIGAVCGIVYFAGFFYFGMLMAGVRWNRVEVLPRYIQFSMQYTTTAPPAGSTHHLYTDDDKFTPTKFHTGDNTVTTVIEVLLSMLFCGVFACMGASGPYSKEFGRWFSSKSLKYPPGVGNYFANGISVEAITQLVATPEMVSDPKKKNEGEEKSVQVSVAFLTAGTGSITMSPERYPVYFSISEGEVDIQQTTLTLEEIAVLQRKIPELGPYVKASGMPTSGA
jgi:hypothetical protein